MDDGGTGSGRGPSRSYADPARAAFEQSPLAQAIVSLDGRFLEVNAAWGELFEVAPSSLVGQPVEVLVAARHLEGSAMELGALRRGELEADTYEAVGRRADGRPLALLVDASVLRDAGGRPHAVAALARDVTEVQQAGRRLAAQEGLFRALSRRSADSAVVMDADLNVVFVSPAVTDTFGHEQAALLLGTFADLIHPGDAERVRRTIADVVTRAEATERVTCRLRDAGGEWRWVEQTVTNCLADPDIGGVVVNLRDITAQVEAEVAMRESEARYRAIVETAQEGILVTAPDGSTILANEVIAEILGISLEDAYAQRLSSRLRVEPVGGSPRTGRPPQQRTELTWAHPDGTERILRVSSSPVSTGEGAFGTLTMVSDVTGARRAEEELRHRALHDSLTDLPNRYLLGDRLAMAAARLERSAATMAVLFLDLDGFKVVNDSQGHEVGDRLLQEVAARLAASVRGADTVARLGGDEFAVICEEADEEVARMVADRIHRALREPVVLDDLSFAISASIGVAVSPPLDPTELLRRADVAMYAAKEAGGAVTAVFGGAGEGRDGAGTPRAAGAADDGGVGQAT